MVASIPTREAYRLTTELLQAEGVYGQNAEVTAKALLLADQWGVRSHGVMRLPWYLDRLAAGGINPRAELHLEEDTGPLTRYDGQGGLGHWQLWRASCDAARRAARYGVAVAAIADSSHCGALGVYVLPPVRRGLVGLVFSNGPAVMPPWGGRDPVFSTSPVAAGIPLADRTAIVDLSLSAVARGTVMEKALAGEDLPDGWALDSQGAPTRDAVAALSGMLAPVGGAKGSVLAFLVECLTGILVGPKPSVDVVDMFDAEAVGDRQGLAHLAIVLDPARLDGDGQQDARLRDLEKRIAATGARIPGARRKPSLDLGGDGSCYIDDMTWRSLQRHAARVGIALPVTSTDRQ